MAARGVMSELYRSTDDRISRSGKLVLQAIRIVNMRAGLGLAGAARSELSAFEWISPRRNETDVRRTAEYSHTKQAHSFKRAAFFFRIPKFRAVPSMWSEQMDAEGTE